MQRISNDGNKHICSPTPVPPPLLAIETDMLCAILRFNSTKIVVLY